MSAPKKDEPQKERPLIPTGVMTEFGEVFEDPETKQYSQANDIDVTYTPGWSELRKQHDRQKWEAAHGKRPPKQIVPLPGNVRLVRRSSANGSPDLRKTAESSNRGYRPITTADVGQPWFKTLPAGAILLPDGSIAKGDCLYMYCPPEQAARNAHQKHQRTMDQLGAPHAKAEGFGMAVDQQKGEDIQLGSQISPTAVPRG
jgi:hypothetical protein